MTRKILFSLLVIGAVVTAFGAITYAIFSDNVASDEQEFSAGTVDIEVNEQDEFFVTELNMTDMEPGNCMTQTLIIHSKGTLPVDLWNWIYTWHEPPPSPTPDPPDIFNCDPNPNCNMYVQKKPIFDPEEPWDKLHHESDFEEWELEACLPLCAGNLCQGGTGKMRMFVHAVQQSELDGWNCVKLLYKEGPLWIPDPTWMPNPSELPAHGNKCYEDSVGAGSNVDFAVNGYNMTANMPLQIMLNGPGGCSVEDSIIAGDFDFDGTVDPGNYDAYYRGFWTGTAMSPSCSGTGEGVYAIAWGGSYHLPGDPGAVTDAAGNFSGQWTATLDACRTHPGTTYTLQTKFLVKQDAAPWLEELDELDYQYITFDCPVP